MAIRLLCHTILECHGEAVIIHMAVLVVILVITALMVCVATILGEVCMDIILITATMAMVACVEFLHHIIMEEEARMDTGIPAWQVHLVGT